MASEKDGFHREVINLDNQKMGKKWKFFGIFIFVIFAVLFLYGIYFKYLSPAAREERQLRESYEKYLEWEQNFEKTMREDTYGGKTPEETLALFIDALKKGDIELASRYFVPNADGSINREWLDQLRQAQQNEQLSQIILWLENAKPDPATPIDDDDYGFIVYGPDNKEIISEINMFFNRYSRVWKIQSL